MKLLSFALCLVGTYLLAPQLLPRDALSAVARLALRWEEWAVAQRRVLVHALRHLPDRPSVKEPLERIGVALGATAALATTLLLLHTVHPLLPSPLRRPIAQPLLGIVILLSFRICADHVFRVRELKAPLLGISTLLRLPALLLGAIPLVAAVAVMAVLIGSTFLALLVCVLPLLYLVRGQLALARLTKGSAPERVLGVVGLSCVALAGYIALWGGPAPQPLPKQDAYPSTQPSTAPSLRPTAPSPTTSSSHPRQAT